MKPVSSDMPAKHLKVGIQRALELPHVGIFTGTPILKDAGAVAAEIVRTIDVAPADGMINAEEAKSLTSTKREEIAALLAQAGANISPERLVRGLLTSGYEIPVECGSVAASAAILNMLAGLGERTVMNVTKHVWRTLYRGADLADKIAAKIGVTPPG